MMKTKLLSLLLLTALLAVGFVSAGVLAEWSLTTDGSPSNVNLNINAGEFTAGEGISYISYTEEGARASSWSQDNLDSTDYFEITLSPKTDYEMTISDINFGERRSLTGIRNYQVQWSKNADFSSATTIATVPVPDDDGERDENVTGLNIKVERGEKIYIRFFGYGAESSTGTWRINDETLNIQGTVVKIVEPEEILACRLLPNDDLQIKIDDINVVSGFGEDEEWLPMDEIEIEIKLENDNNDEKIKDIVVGWGLYDEEEDKWYIDDEENDFNLKKKDDKTIVVTFKLDDDIDELEDYDKFYVWANAIDYEDTEICTYASEDILIQDESDFVIVDDIKIVDSVECDMDLQIAADVWNIGSDDQEGVYVIISEPDLGIYKRVEIGDIDSFDDEKLDVTVQIPEDAEEGSYFLKIKVYDEDDDIYENDYDEDESVFMIPLKVEGNCKVAPQATVTATLDSDAKSGKELTIKSTIKNIGSEQETYILEAADYTTWASLKDINPKVIVLEAGESAEVIYQFNINKDVEGAQTFNIVVKTGETEKETMKQPVSVTITKSQGFSFPGLTGNAIEGDNWYLWGIGLLNVILIIIIIIVAIRVARS